jgi:hypothetical protein
VPETRVERALFGLGVLAVAVLGVLVARLWHHTRSSAHPATSLSTLAGTPGTRPAKSATATITTATTHVQTTTPASTRGTTTAAAVGGVSLRLTAKTATWLEVRSGSSTGSVLYSGTLAAASTKTFRARSLWARFGAAGNVSARFNGRALRLPAGTYDATFDGRGFERAS